MSQDFRKSLLFLFDVSSVFGLGEAVVGDLDRGEACERTNRDSLNRLHHNPLNTFAARRCGERATVGPVLAGVERCHEIGDVQLRVEDLLGSIDTGGSRGNREHRCHTSLNEFVSLPHVEEDTDDKK